MNTTQGILYATLFCLFAVASTKALALQEDMGNGCLHHGVATPVSNHRGTVATVDANGNNVVLLWLYDSRGGYALLLIDAETGKSEEYPVPFPPGGDCPYASILSSKNRFYTHFNSYFVEFDPAKRAFTFYHATAPQMAMGMTEDDQGRIWSVTYPDSGVVCYDPASQTFKDFGHVYKQNWQQYQRYVATDDKGWLYFGIGNTASQIIAFDPQTATATPLLAEEDRVKGSAYVIRDMNGKVYGNTGNEEKWFELYEGKATPIPKPNTINKKPIITGTQALFHRNFPDGKILKECDLVEKILVVEDPKTQETRTAHFEYSSEGAHIMSVAVSPDGTICGGTSFPMRFFSYDPKRDSWVNRECYGQWNTVARQGDKFFIGGYPSGFLLEWDPAKDWKNTEKDNPACNPLFLTQCTPDVYRPHDLLAHPDGKTLVFAGTPAYGYTGGGLFFWDRETRTGTQLRHTDLIPEHSIMSLAALKNGRLIAGTTTAPGTGGEKKAQQAELLILDMETKKITWHEPIFPGVQEYTDLVCTASGVVYGVADRKIFFVFDPDAEKVIRTENLGESFGPTTTQQGPRVFVMAPDNTVYMLFVKGIARIDRDNHSIAELMESPVPVGPGGDYLDGRIYFASGSHLYSLAVSTTARQK